ncbi:MAG: zinc ABC transporter substrate-binding protein [Thermodesulfobacteriota bacterium]
MKTVLPAVLACLVLLSHPVRAQAPAAPRVPVAVSVLPLAWFVEKIGGDRVDVSVLVGPGADPHTFEPKPAQMVALARDKALFTVGAPFEKAWTPRFLAMNPKLLVVDASRGLARIPMEDDHHHEGDSHGEEGSDPHVWLSPKRAPFLARNILDGLCRVSPEGKEYFMGNYRVLAADLALLDKSIAGMLAGLPCRAFMVFHPSWGYFADDYGLTQLAIQTSGSEPGAGDLARILDRSRKEKISVIFVAPQFSKRSAEVVAQSLGAAVAEADPLPADLPGELRRLAAEIRGSCLKRSRP